MSGKKDDMAVLFFNRATFRAAEEIFRFPSKTFHLRELARETGLSKSATSQAVSRLAAFRIVAVEKSDATTNIHADVESLAYSHYKLLFNLYRLFAHGLVEQLRQAFQPKAIVLFGSFARGEDFEQSDVDICVLSDRRPTPELQKLLHAQEADLKRKISLHVLPSLQRSDAAFKNALANGIVLHGYLELA